MSCLVWLNSPQLDRASLSMRFLDHTQRRTTVGRTPLDEWSARRTDLYLTIYNTHNRQISMPPVGFERTISAGERPQTYALYRAATGTGSREVQQSVCLSVTTFFSLSKYAIFHKLWMWLWEEDFLELCDKKKFLFLLKKKGILSGYCAVGVV